MVSLGLVVIDLIMWVRVLIISFLGFPFSGLGQSAYISTDSSHHQGIIESQGPVENAQTCLFKSFKNNPTITYTAHELKEYGLIDGRIFVSKNVLVDGQSRQVFLERLVKGKLSLYYYRGKSSRVLFLEHISGELIALSSKDFKVKLETVLDGCDQVSSQLPSVKYGRSSLSRFIENYNKCNNSTVPDFRLGVLIGGSSTGLVFNTRNSFDNILGRGIYERDLGLIGGIFIEVPIFSTERFIVVPELLYRENAFASTVVRVMSQDDLIVTSNITMKSTTLELPVLFRYTVPSTRYQYYFAFGPHPSFLIKNDLSINESAQVRQMIDQKVVEIEHASRFQAGFALSVGTRLPIIQKHKLSIEVRYNKSWGIDQARLPNLNSFVLLTRLSI